MQNRPVNAEEEEVLEAIEAEVAEDETVAEVVGKCFHFDSLRPVVHKIVPHTSTASPAWYGSLPYEAYIL